MVDNPKTFIIIVITVVVILVAIIAGFRLSSDEESDLGDEATTTAETTVSDSSTEKSARTETKTQVPAKTPTGPIAYDVLITYTNQGFVPNSVEVKAGTSVRFINKSDGAMRIWSVENASVPNYYADLKQSGSVGNGGVFDFTFPRAGTWLYQNLNNTSKVGVVIVK